MSEPKLAEAATATNVCQAAWQAVDWTRPAWRWQACAAGHRQSSGRSIDRYLAGAGRQLHWTAVRHLAPRRLSCNSSIPFSLLTC